MIKLKIGIDEVTKRKSIDNNEMILTPTNENKYQEKENIRGKYTMQQKELNFYQMVEFYNRNENFSFNKP